MRNFFLGILITILIIGVGYFAYQTGKKEVKPAVISNITPLVVELSPTQTIVGDDRDIHGCIGSAGYTWCEEKQKCLRLWEESCSGTDDTEAIKQALVKKHGWNPDEIIVTISKNDGTYAAGGVKEKTSEVGGGYFFAAKVNGGWQIVADGNGIISCQQLSPYPNYPRDYIPECYDESTGKIQTR